MMHFPLFQISPLFSKNFRTQRKIFKLLPFLEKFLDFHPPKFLMTFFLVIDHKFRISPYFCCFSTFPPCFAKIILSPPTFTNFTLVLGKFTCLILHTLRVFPPYFDHDAFVHHPMHVLDASGTWHPQTRSRGNQLNTNSHFSSSGHDNFDKLVLCTYLSSGALEI